ncbi:hypothetical protein PR048_000983 [Dryococelus australis]|uniref:Uncharacterized protein n=1 Tax=Dryococelus australis TaxID=614101 RepID=A0ABQ9IG62_9NEOP|nr:hypothetical protein PR048_000983 [Dryococelus australis]
MSSFTKYDHSHPKSWAEHLERFHFWLDLKGQITNDQKRGLLIDMLDDHSIHDLKDWITHETLRDRTYIELINVLNKNIVPTLNPMVCCSQYVNRRQLPSEKAVLASSCNFEGMVATIVLYQSVCGLLNADLQAKLFSEKELTAMKALDFVQLAQRFEENVIEVRNLCVEDIHKCVEVGHTAAKCPLPRNSLKVGHVIKACKQRDKSLLRSAETDHVYFVDNIIVAVVSSGVHYLAVSPKNVDLSYPGAHASSLHNESLFMISDRNSSLYTKSYSVQIQVNNVLMQFEIDSGRSRAHLNLDMYTTNFVNFDHGSVSHQRTCASQSSAIIEEFQVVVKYKHFTCNLPVLVVDGVGPNPLGRNWFQALDISIQGVFFLSPDTSYAGMYNEAFALTIMHLPTVSGHGTGCYKGHPLHINMNSDVAPV